MTKLIIIDNCTACPFFYRFQNPHLGEICFKVTDKEQHFRGIESRPKDAIPDWCPLPEKIIKGGKTGHDKETVEKVCKMGKISCEFQYDDGRFEIPLEDWDKLLKKLHIDRSEIMNEKGEDN